jgi:hypothetical protein
MMRIFDKELLKLSVSVGLVVGFVSLGLGMWLGVEWWFRQWFKIREILGLGMGVIYTVRYSVEIRRMEWRLLAAKYGIYVYVIILTWLGWLMLVWLASGDGANVADLGRWAGLHGNIGWTGWLIFLINGVWQGLKIVGLGLMVVLGWRFIKPQDHETKKRV